MFSTLDRYILRQMLQTLAISALALIVLVWLMNSLRFFDWFINKNLSIGIFLQLTVLLLPGFLTVFMPIALFAVSIFTYSRLVADRELVVMRAAGLGPWQLARPALMIATVLTVIGYILTVWVVPDMERRFSELHHNIRNELSQLVLREGQFNKAEETLIIYVRERTVSGELLGLLIHDTSTVGAPVTILAERGTMVKDQGVSKMLLINGSRQEKKEDTGKVSFLYFDSYTIEVGEDTDSADISRFRKERERPFMELFTIQPGDPVGEGLDWTFGDQQVMPLRMEGHLRILKPINHFGFLLLGLAAVLKGQFNRRGDSSRVILAVALVVVFQSASLGAANIAKRSYDALPLLDAMTLIPLIIGIVWMSWGGPGSGGTVTRVATTPATARAQAMANGTG